LLGLGGLFIVGGIGAAVAAITLSNDPPPEPVAPPTVAVAAPPPEPVVDPDPVPVEVPTVRIVTTPDSAEVWNGEEFLGQTPLDVPRPDGTDRLALELRKPGFKVRRLAISSATLSPELNFTLQEEEEERRRGSGSRRPPAGAQPPPPQQQETRMGRTLIQAEVVDPWAN
jgi:hypothetical protein